MVNKRKKYAFLSLMMVITIACGFSFGENLSEEEKLQTVVAETVAANQAQRDDEPEAPLPTITTAPDEPQPSGPPTKTPLPCNKADFVSETVEDGTQYGINENFTKTWRLKNIGTCTWNTNYKLVFNSGDKMSGPDNQNLTQSVAPGESVDISVNLKAPDTTGTYKGFWKVADDNGNFFVNTIWVEIEAIPVLGPPPLPPAVAALSIEQVDAEGGCVWTGGTVYSTLYNVGDSSTNKGSQVFASFDMTGIPAGSTITDVQVDFSDYDKLGDPWGDLNCLRIYTDDYGILDGLDFTPAPGGGALKSWCNDGDLGSVTSVSNLKNALQAKVGSNRFQARLQFSDMETNGDDNADMVRFGIMKIHVTYELP